MASDSTPDIDECACRQRHEFGVPPGSYKLQYTPESIGWVNYLIFTHYVSPMCSKSAESICTTCGSRWKMHSPTAAEAAAAAKIQLS